MSNRSRSALQKQPHLRGFLAKSPLLAYRVAAIGSPDTPLGFSPTLGSHPAIPLARRADRSHPSPVRGPTEIGSLRTAAPPKRTCDTTKTVALEPSDLICFRLRGRQCDPGSRSRAYGFPHAPSMPKHRAGATAFQGPSLPMHRVTAETHPPYSVGMSACADRRACARRRRVSSPGFPQVTTSHVI